MSKGSKNINIEIKEIATGPFSVWEVVSDGKKTIGTIEQENKKFKITTAKDQHEAVVGSLNDAINEILVYFNLHEK